MPLTDTDLDNLSAALAFARPDTCVIKRRAAGKTAGGGMTAGHPITVATVGCRVEGAGRMLREIGLAMKAAPVGDRDVSMPRGTDVKPDDEIEVNGTTLEVIGTNATDTYAAEVVAECRSIK